MAHYKLTVIITDYVPCNVWSSLKSVLTGSVKPSSDKEYCTDCAASGGLQIDIRRHGGSCKASSISFLDNCEV